MVVPPLFPFWRGPGFGRSGLRLSGLSVMVPVVGREGRDKSRRKLSFSEIKDYQRQGMRSSVPKSSDVTVGVLVGYRMKVAVISLMDETVDYSTPWSVILNGVSPGSWRYCTTVQQKPKKTGTILQQQQE